VSIDDLPEQVKQFQNTEYSKNGVSKLLESLNKELKDKTLKKQLKAVLEYNWPSLDGKIQEIIPSKKKQPIPKKREDMQVQEAINDSLNTQKTQKKVNRMSRSLQLLALSIETPAYFLDKTFRITYANLSTALIFGIFINKAKGKLISDIIEQKKDEILNYDEVMQHLAETFSDPQNMPPYDFELIKFKHKKYGNINLEKIALAVRDPDRQLEIESWVIAFNITSIDKLETYYSDLKGAITNYFQFEEQRQW
jgi:transcriptional regulator with PAS, ATPase and Fis domain